VQPIAITVTDTDGDADYSTLNIRIADDAPVAGSGGARIYVGVDTLAVTNLQAGWQNDTYVSGSGSVIRSDLDSDAYNDRISWGRGNNYSSYVLVDNPAYTGSSGSSIALGQLFKLGDFTHNNFPLNSGSTTLDYTDMVITMNVVVNGVSTPVSFTVRLDHTETPDSSDPVASRDIISLLEERGAKVP
jgi:hypothetical protein